MVLRTPMQVFEGATTLYAVSYKGQGATVKGTTAPHICCLALTIRLIYHSTMATTSSASKGCCRIIICPESGWLDYQLARISFIHSHRYSEPHDIFAAGSSHITVIFLFFIFLVDLLNLGSGGKDLVVVEVPPAVLAIWDGWALANRRLLRTPESAVNWRLRER
jgi:hypothetical protein